MIHSIARFARRTAGVAILLGALALASNAGAQLPPDLVTHEVLSLRLVRAQLGQQAPPDLLMRGIPRLSASELAVNRGICAQDDTGRLFANFHRGDQEDAARAGWRTVDIPPVTDYCLEILNVSARRGFLPDLYIALALGELGHSYGLYSNFAEQAQLLSNDEAGQTTGLILRAALAGQNTYASIRNVTRPLPCPLAFDAGYTWAFRNPDRQQPYTFSRAEAERIAQACYMVGAAQINVSGQTLPAQQAGLYAGAYFGREAARSAAR